MMNRDEILKYTSGGLDVFRHYVNGGWKIGVKFLNPFYQDTKKACSIYYDRKSNKYKICDHGDKRYSGDCFALVGVINGLDSNNPHDFHQILQIINHDMRLDDSSSEAVIYPKQTVTQPHDDETDDEPPHNKQYKISTRDFNASEIKFWNQAGITLKTLAKYNVVAVDRFDSISQKGEPYTFRSSINAPMFGYVSRDFVKLYRPYSQSRFLYGGKIPERYCFGLEQLPIGGDVVFITGGEKDVMSLSENGFAAICFGSETNNVSRPIIERLSFIFKHIVILYDMDKTGINCSKKLMQSLSEFNVKRLELPLSGKKEDKDVTDFFCKGGTAKQLHGLYIEMLNKLYDNTAAILRSCEIDLDSPPQAVEGLVSIKNVALGTQGDLLCITGGEGTGKSNFVGAFIAGAIRDEGETIDTLGVSIKRNSEGHAVVLYDTEQSKFQLYKNSNAILRRSKLNTKPQWFKPYSLMLLPRKIRLQTIASNLDHLYNKFGGIHMVVVDGVADLVRSANDEGESIAIIEELYRLAAMYNTCIVCVLHFVPNGLKLRGHLGSELQRKAAAIISVERDDDPQISLVKALKVRDGSALDIPILQFAWDETLMMHTFKGAKPKDERNKRKYEELMAVVNEIFRTSPQITYAELCEQLQSALSVKLRTAKSYIKYLRDKEIIINNSKELKFRKSLRQP